jgi:tripartite-type tricarboxylate transporter receptor subunit TctC
MLKKILLGLACIAALGVTSARADYPERAIQFFVPFAVGGGSDRTARVLIPYLEKYLGDGAKIAVVNKPGAGGNIAYSELASTAADGYTIAMVNLPDAVTGPMLNKSLPYDSQSFIYIGGINKEATTISVQAKDNIKNFDDYVKAAKDKDGKMTVGVPAIGSVHSVGVTKLLAAMDFKINKIPLGGGGPTRNALLGGHIDSAALSVSAAAKKAKNLTILMLMGDERSAIVPNVPTTRELGIDVTNYVIRTFAAPKGTPPEVLSTLRSAFEKAIKDPAFLADAKKQKVAVSYSTGDELEAIATALDAELRALWETHPWM